MNKLFPVILLALCISCVQQRPEPKEEAAPEAKPVKLEFDPHFSHTVFIWLKNPDSAEDRQVFEAALETFLENSEFAQTNYVGIPPKSTREVVDDCPPRRHG